MEDTIAAIATAPGEGGIGVVRISGEKSKEILEKIFLKKNSEKDLVPRMMHYGFVRNNFSGELIDEVMAVYFKAPYSYTAEDVVEIQCHGSMVSLRKILSLVLKNGARIAESGEFTKRAFLNGKMDLTQAEAVIDLIHAETALDAKNAAGQLGGAVLRRAQSVYDALQGIAESVYDKLLDVSSRFYAVVDYPDEDIPDFQLNAYEATMQNCITQLQCLLDTFSRANVLHGGVPAVILGRPNAGKSSLLNALLGYDRAIVTEVAGTTRDTVEEKVRLGGQMLLLCDTAGIRDARDSVERIGVDRAVAAAERASLSLVVLDGSVPLTGTEERIFALAQQAEHSLLLVNKSDLPRQAELAGLADRFDGVCSVCARTGEGVEQIGRLVQALYPQAVRTDGALLTNTRQAEAVGRALAAVDRAQGALSAALTPDAILTDAEEALAALGELTGKSIREDLVATIFSRFCVGK